MNHSIESTSAPITPGTVLSRQIAAQQERIHALEAVEIRDHQQEAMKAIDAFLKSGHTAGHVEMATATGKTFLISTIAQAAADLGMRTLILAPTVRIAQQLTGENGDKGLGKFTDLHETGRVGQRFGTRLAQQNLEQPVVVSTYQSLNSLEKAGLAPVVDLIIADEAHRSLGEVTSQTMGSFSPNAIKIGFTATPAYSDEKSLDQLLPEKIFSLDIRESVERGLTPPITSLVYETGQEVELLDPQRKEFTERELARLINLKARNEAIVQFSRDFVQSGMQGAVACLPGSDLAHAKLVADELNKTEITDKDGIKRMIRAISVGAHRTVEDNDTIIAAYDDGLIDVLTFVYSLEQGWDSESPRFMINASPTTSEVRETQLLGRLLRGDDDVYFVDFLDVAKKRQYTSLHVLGEETIDYTRKVGGRQRKNDIRDRGVSVGDILSSDLFASLTLTNGKLIRDLFVNEKPSEFDRLYSKWNRILESEGLTEELPELFDAKPSPAAIETYAGVQKALGRWAMPKEAVKYAFDNGLTRLKSRNPLLAQMESAAALAAQKVPIQGLEIYQDIDITPEQSESRALYSKIEEILDELSDREAGIIRMRFGLSSSGQQSIEEIAQYFGVSKDRIKQVESRTMAKLRSGHRREVLESYVFEQPDSEQKPQNNVTKLFGPDELLRQKNFLPIVRDLEYDRAVFDMVRNISEDVVPQEGLSRLSAAEARALSRVKFGDEINLADISKLAAIQGYTAGVKAYLGDPETYQKLVQEAEDVIPMNMSGRYIMYAGSFEQFHGYMLDVDLQRVHTKD